jgi:hypothetical protein
MRNNLKTILLTFFFCIGTSSTFMVVSAQPTTDPCDTEFPDNPPPHCIPIDGGLLLLLAAGVGYGIKKSHLDRNRHQEDTQVHS